RATNDHPGGDRSITGVYRTRLVAGHACRAVAERPQDGDNGAMKDTRTSGQLVRHIPAEGTYNLRDVGGYRADGGAVKWRTIFRSDALHRLTASGKRTIVDLGVGRVIDLRDRREI